MGSLQGRGTALTALLGRDAHRETRDGSLILDGPLALERLGSGCASRTVPSEILGDASRVVRSSGSRALGARPHSSSRSMRSMTESTELSPSQYASTCASG
mmetsp:Transcript_23731/g.51185  ORF Transcript_23731/g.51185 Transcript_23731/m.51185 type:complete len:101 (-) Transcript_23731:111-413(-)